MTGRQTFDLLIVGGGINGVGIARDAAGRGLKVFLCEQDDLAGHTSSASTKLIHGGLRYLEHYEFRLVREALAERELLLRAAPHIIWPLRFVLPHERHLRPAWMIRLGLFLYDHLSGRKLLPGSRGIALRGDFRGEPLDSRLNKAFVYSDCWVQDARLVVLNAMDAAERKAEIRTRTRCVAAERGEEYWTARLLCARTGREQTISARALVNATGPWVRSFLDHAAHTASKRNVRLVKGSHIVAPKWFEHDHAYIFQNPDRRIIFAIPYERDFTLVGTTEMDYEGNPAAPSIAPAEIDYLCAAMNRYFQRKMRSADAVSCYSGVRPLYDNAESSASAVTRDYVLDLDVSHGQAPLLSVFGGKLTTYRKLAEQALDKLRTVLPIRQPTWTASAALPGGDIAHADFDHFLSELRRAKPWLPEDLTWRYARNYGARVEKVLGGATALPHLGEEVAADLYEAELEYLLRYEWAQTAQDILWRRSKLGLHLADGAAERVDAWLGRAGRAGVRGEVRDDLLPPGSLAAPFGYTLF